MRTKELTVIIPVRNVEREVTGILRSLTDQASGLNAEFLVVDMGSTDRTLVEAVQFFEDSAAEGFVIQTGNGNVSSALNAGIRHAAGDYISFIFARRLYQNFLKTYLETAEKYTSDLVFGCFSENEKKLAERRLVSTAVRNSTGADYLREILGGRTAMDISALMFRRGFLAGKHLYFQEECSNGYAEEFLYSALLRAEHIAQAPVVLVRDSSLELDRGKQTNIGKSIFQYVDAMLRVEDVVRTEFRQDKDLLELFESVKLPQTVLFCIDVLLREGLTVHAVRSYLKRNNYDRLIVAGRQTDNALRRRIQLWRRLPWIYRPGMR